VPLTFAVAHGLVAAAVLAGPWRRGPMAVALVVGIGLWWASNTVAHIHIHTPLFAARVLNRLFAAYLTVLTGVPQALWRARHLWHHAGEPAGRRPPLGRDGPWHFGLVALLWLGLAWLDPRLFLLGYLPGYALGLALCGLHGRLEHAGRALAADPGVSHYGRAYNLLWLNDGYHAEHHRWPGEHWRRLPDRRLGAPAVRTSALPPVLRWLAPGWSWAAEAPGASPGVGRRALSPTRPFRRAVPDGADALPLPPADRETPSGRLVAGVLDLLERGALLHPALCAFATDRHGRALEAALAGAPARPRRVGVVGGGLFPRTALALRRLLPDCEIVVLERSARHIARARRYVEENGEPRGIAFVHASFDRARHGGFDVLVFPLGLRGDRDALYRDPPAPILFVHDWLWRRRGARGVVVSALLLKRLNVVLGPSEPASARPG